MGNKMVTTDLYHDLSAYCIVVHVSPMTLEWLFLLRLDCGEAGGRP